MDDVVLFLVIVGVFLAACVGATIMGTKLLRSAARRPEDTNIVTAQIANPHGFAKVKREAKGVGRGVKRVVGVVLILAPWALLVAVYQALAR
jgi:hypothetical protein